MKTALLTVASGQWYFRQLFADVRRLARAHTPNEGWFYATGALEEYKDLIQPWQFSRMDAKYVRIRIAGKHFGVKPGTDGFPGDIVETAGVRKE